MCGKGEMNECFCVTLGHENKTKCTNVIAVVQVTSSMAWEVVMPLSFCVGSVVVRLQESHSL